MFKEHEKFWAFIALLVSIVGLATVATFLGDRLTGSEAFNDAAAAMLTAKLRILELITVGLIGVAGAAGQALFRTSENANAMNDILKSALEGLKASAPVNDNKPAPQDAVEAASQVASAAEDEATRIQTGGK
jgi:hypothetical protein